MAAVKDIQAQFLRQRVSPMRPFAGDERVHAFLRGLFQLRARAAGHHADAFACRAASGYHERFRTGGALQSPRQLRERNFGLGLEPDVLAVAEEERAQVLQPERGAKPRVVAQLRMRVQRQMRTVNRQIVFQQQPQQFVAPAGPWMGRRPEQPVMRDQQVRPGRDGQFHRRQARVHRGGDARDAAAVLRLQPVHRAVIVADGLRAKNPVQVTDDGGEGGG